MKHRAALTGALCAAFILAFAASVTAAPAKTAPTKTAPTPMGQVSAGSAAPAPMAEPEPAPTPAPTFGADGDRKPGENDAIGKKEAGHRIRMEHRLTGILVPIAFFLSILLLVGTIQYMGLRKDRNKHQTLQLMVEKGAQIPVEMITNQKRRGSDLRRGLVLLGAGLGISLFLLMTKDARNSGAFGLGLVPALIGAGYLLAWKLEGRKQDALPSPTATFPPGNNIAQTRHESPNADETLE